MLELINANVDDVVDASVAVRWLNAGQNKMAAEARASFKQLNAANINETFDFPEKYHEVPVLYACAMFMASESSVAEKESYLRQFEDGVKLFTENYDTPVEFRDDSNTQHFTKTSTDENKYFITKRGYSDRSNLKVYLNGVETTLFSLIDRNGFQLLVVIDVQEPQNGDKITARWEDRPDLQEPPYPWMKAW
jgi:hypothetical protein